MSVIIAIDPGAHGALCVLSDGNLTVNKMGECLRDTCDILEQAQRDSFGGAFDASSPPAIRVVIEKVSGYIGEAQPASSAFNFGAGYGALLGMLTALRIPFELATSQQWQKGLSLGSRGLQKATITPNMTDEERKTEKRRVSSLNNKLKREWKAKLRDTAQRLYPHIKVTLQLADALLILEWARRRESAPMARTPEPAQKELAV